MKSYKEIWIPGCALVVSASSFVLALLTAERQMEYYRLSVVPKLVIGYNDVAQGIGGKYSGAIQLKNKGLGPAEIVYVQVKVDGNPINNWTDFSKKMQIQRISSFALPGGNFYRAGEEIVLFSVSDEQDIEKLRANSHRISYSICYCSIYKKCWVKSSEEGVREVSSCPLDGRSIGAPEEW